jgi:hypothetical protein
MTSMRNDLRIWTGEKANELVESLLAAGFCGYDPYDALASPLVGALPGRWHLARRLAIQGVKRSPIALRPLLGISPGVSATTIGYWLVASARLHRAGILRPAVASVVRRVAGFLRSLAVLDTDQQLAWGSHVDVATRFGFTPSSLPNVVVTATAAHGLAAVTTAGLASESVALHRVARFITSSLSRRTSANDPWFAYTPEHGTMVHNGSMLAAATLIRVGEVTGEEELIQQAVMAVRTTTRYQRSNGSWPYAEGPSGQWEDSFHTGFILEALLAAWRYERAEWLAMALDVGGKRYSSCFFGPAGEPWYYSAKHYPIDAMAAAEGLEVLPLLAPSATRAGTTATRLGQWCRRRMVRDDGAIAYQVHPLWTDWRQFPRWTAAPMASALSGMAAGPEQASKRTDA